MEEKRQVPSLLKSILTWDADITSKVVRYIDRLYGPLTIYKDTFKCLEISCHGIPWLIVTFAMIFFIESKFINRLCLNLFLALLVDITIVAVTKAFTRRRRPAENQNDMFASYAMDKFSFPSGHSTRAVMLALRLPYEWNPLPYFPWFLLIWSGAVCTSRILMRRHHLLDVAGGIVIGWMEVYVIHYMTWLPPSSADALLDFMK